MSVEEPTPFGVKVSVRTTLLSYRHMVLFFEGIELKIEHETTGTAASRVQGPKLCQKFVKTQLFGCWG